MRKFRDVFYVKTYPERNETIYYGMEFTEFMNCEPNKIKNLLLLNTNLNHICGMILVQMLTLLPYLKVK